MGAVSVTSTGADASATITRPANATPYTAGDVVGGAFELPNFAVGPGSLMVTAAELEIDVSAVPSGMGAFNLYLYSATPPSAIADNAAFALASGDRSVFLRKIPITGTPASENGTLYVSEEQINRQLKAPGTSVWAYLVTVAGYTPAGNSEVYKPTTHTIGL